MNLVPGMRVLLYFQPVDRSVMRMNVRPFSHGIVFTPGAGLRVFTPGAWGISGVIVFVLAGPLLACSDREGPSGSGNNDTGISPGFGSESSTGGATSTDGSGLDDDGDEFEGSAENGSASSTGAELVCGEATFVIDAVPPNVMLVLDKSGSMAREEWDADGDPATPEVRRWTSLHNVVSFIAGAFDTDINFGTVLFPATNAVSEFSERGCRMTTEPNVPVAPMNAAAVLAAIPPADAADGVIQGGTPATAGIRVATEHLRTLDPAVPRFMILVTDGAANCSSDVPVCGGAGCAAFEQYDAALPIAVADALATDGIATFVVGIDIVNAVVGTNPYDGYPEANTYEKLNEVAVAGGQARPGDEKFFNALNEAELQAALSDIAGQLVSCRIPLDPPPDHPDYISIEIDGKKLERVSDCETENGWVFANPNGPYDEVILCNAACDDFFASGDIDARYGCPPAG